MLEEIVGLGFDEEFERKVFETWEEVERVLREKRRVMIAYSGGKDSTLCLHLFLKTYDKIKPTECEVLVVTVDTKVEIPSVIANTRRFLEKVEKFAKEKGYRIGVRYASPEIEDSFWWGVMVKGYVMPRFNFRWCVSRLKIKPVNRVIKEFRPDVIVLGSRVEESGARRRSIEKRVVGGKWAKYKKGLQAFMPIMDWNTDEVWTYLLRATPPWGGDYFDIYKNYNHVGTCEMNEKGGFSCGGSRSGCWTCSVVSKDKILENIIAKGDEVARRLAEFKRELIEITRDPKNRLVRENGTLGATKKEVRRMIFEKLEALQEELKDVEVIGEEERKMISERLVGEES